MEKNEDFKNILASIKGIATELTGEEDIHDFIETLNKKVGVGNKEFSPEDLLSLDVFKGALGEDVIKNLSGIFNDERIIKSVIGKGIDPSIFEELIRGSVKDGSKSKPRANKKPESKCESVVKDCSDSKVDRASDTKSELVKYALPVDIFESSSHYIMEIELAGMKKDSINIIYKDEHLIVEGIREVKDRRNNGYKQILDSGKRSDIRLVFELPAIDINNSDNEAVFIDGLLSVYLMKDTNKGVYKIHIR